MITFRPVEARDIPDLHRWRNEPHVMRWWYEDDDSEPTYDVVARNYGPDHDDKEHRYIIEMDGRSIGYIQMYLLSDWPDYAALIQEQGAGIDLFIGEPDLVNKGVGTEVIDRFLQDVVFADPAIEQCVIDPEISNSAAVRAYTKAGFTPVRTVEVPNTPGPELIMVRKREGRPTGRPS
jgi:aminoglycoside 6'-N-acetyltransferase